MALINRDSLEKMMRFSKQNGSAAILIFTFGTNRTGISQDTGPTRLRNHIEEALKEWNEVGQFLE